MTRAIHRYETDCGPIVICIGEDGVTRIMGSPCWTTDNRPVMRVVENFDVTNDRGRLRLSANLVPNEAVPFGNAVTNQPVHGYRYMESVVNDNEWLAVRWDAENAQPRYDTFGTDHQGLWRVTAVGAKVKRYISVSYDHSGLIYAKESSGWFVYGCIAVFDYAAGECLWMHADGVQGAMRQPRDYFQPGGQVVRVHFLPRR